MSTSPKRLGRYELQQRLAQGGMGEVWKALDTQLQRTVAIKVLHTEMQDDASFASRFEREAQLIAALHHPHIIQVHNFDFALSEESHNTIAYMVMDYVQGQTLADYIRNTARNNQFPPANEVIYLLTGISLALDYAHRKDMIHRDIKPANILLDQRSSRAMPIGSPILTDFGIARLQSAPSKTTIGSILGTPHYMSPEQVKGQPGDARSDLYSLGIILYEMMTGVTPFRGDTVIAILMQHLNDMPTPPALINAQITPAVSAVMLKSIAKAPEERYPSAAAMTIALAYALGVPVPQSLLTNPSTPSQPGIVSSPIQPSLPLTPQQWSNLSNSRADAQYQQYQQPVVHNSYTDPITPPGDIRILPAQAAPISPISAAPPPQQQTQPVRRRLLWYILLPILALVVIASGLTAYFIFSQKGTTTPPTPTIVGNIHFTRSTTAPIGSYDTLQIQLDALPTLPSQYAYYAWIDATNTENTYPHWQLSTQSGPVHLSGLTDPAYNHGNLLAQPGLFLITKELITGPAPIIPSLEPGARLSYAQISSSTATYDLKPCPPQGNVCG